MRGGGVLGTSIEKPTGEAASFCSDVQRLDGRETAATTTRFYEISHAFFINCVFAYVGLVG